jgi:hypothetical protein
MTESPSLILAFLTWPEFSFGNFCFVALLNPVILWRILVRTTSTLLFILTSVMCLFCGLTTRRVMYWLYWYWYQAHEKIVKICFYTWAVNRLSYSLSSVTFSSSSATFLASRQCPPYHALECGDGKHFFSRVDFWLCLSAGSPTSYPPVTSHDCKVKISIAIVSHLVFYPVMRYNFVVQVWDVLTTIHNHFSPN